MSIGVSTKHITGCLDEVLSSENSGIKVVMAADDIIDKLAYLQTQVNMLTEELGKYKKDDRQRLIPTLSPESVTSELSEMTTEADDATSTSDRVDAVLEKGTKTITPDESSIKEEQQIHGDVAINSLSSSNLDKAQDDGQSSNDFEEQRKEKLVIAIENFLHFASAPISQETSRAAKRLTSPREEDEDAAGSAVLQELRSPRPVLNIIPDKAHLPRKSSARQMSNSSEEGGAILPADINMLRRVWRDDEIVPFDSPSIYKTEEQQVEAISAMQGSASSPFDDYPVSPTSRSVMPNQGGDSNAMEKDGYFGQNYSKIISNDKGPRMTANQNFDLDLFSFIGKTRKVESRKPSSTRDWESIPSSDGIARRKSSTKKGEEEEAKKAKASVSSAGRRPSVQRERKDSVKSISNSVRRPSDQEDDSSGRMSRLKDKLPGSWPFKTSRSQSTDMSQ